MSSTMKSFVVMLIFLLFSNKILKSQKSLEVMQNVEESQFVPFLLKKRHVDF